MTAAEFIYTVILKPRPLKLIANALIRRIIPKRLAVSGGVVVLNPRDPVVSGALTFGVYEKPETTFFCEACKPGMTVLDIGANVGYYTALAMARVAGGSIIAMEPDEESFRYLQQTVHANGAVNTICVPKAAASQNGTVRLYTSTLNRADNRLYPNELASDSCDVEAVTVDSLLAELHVPSVDLVKIDVQGFEGHVLRGMRATISQSPHLIILIEFWPHGLRSAGTNPIEVLTEWEDMGLRLFELTHRSTLQPLSDKQGLVNRLPGKRYTNIVAYRGPGTPPLLDGRQPGGRL
ncbi:MAG TPA: FkbM family methyltransferase [Bryobacteraceae bacterium]|nr:FkbM family methyltransferase [Bryobacteraceae bacterium]